MKPYFYGIREFIKAAIATDYYAEPNYEMFHNLLLHMMDYNKVFKEQIPFINNKIASK